MVGSGNNFTDTDFPTIESSYSTFDIGSKTTWARARDIVKGASTWGSEGHPDPSDVRQRELGDCYYLAACSAVAEFEGRIKRVFKPKVQEYPNEGIYAFTVYIRGIPRTIVIDDFLPFKGTSSKKLYLAINSSDNGIWSPLLEKVWAKAMGSYLTIKGGQAREGFDFLTGGPTDLIYFEGKTVDEIWNTISAFDKKDYIISCSTAGKGNDQETNPYGIAMSHAYSIIGAFEIKDSNGKVTNRLY